MILSRVLLQYKKQRNGTHSLAGLLPGHIQTKQIKTPILISTHTWTKKMPTFPSPNLWQWLIFIQAKAGLSWIYFAALNNKSPNKMTTHPLQSILHKLSYRWIDLLSSPNINESCQQPARNLFFPYYLLIVWFHFFFGLCLLVLSFALYFWWMGSHPWFL